MLQQKHTQPDIGNVSEKGKTIERWWRKITSLKEFSYDSGIARIKGQFMSAYW